jgi:hypothetical protein
LELLPISAAKLAGRMAEWLCNGLQIRVQRFDSASGLQRSKYLKQSIISASRERQIAVIAKALGVIPV